MMMPWYWHLMMMIEKLPVRGSEVAFYNLLGVAIFLPRSGFVQQKQLRATVKK